MNTISPKISIVTVCMNAAATISTCLDSVSNQVCSEKIEHILIDGKSSDNTLELIKSREIRVAYVSSEVDSGIYDAMNKGLAVANGDIIGILNADDYYHSSDIIEKILSVFEDPTVDACYGDLVYVDSMDKVVRYWKAKGYSIDSLYWGWMPPHPTLFVRRSIYEKYGVFNVNLGSSADYEIILRFFLKHKIMVKYIPEILVRMRVGGVSNASLGNRIKANKMDSMAWKVNDLKPYFFTTFLKPVSKLNQWLRTGKGS